MLFSAHSFFILVAITLSLTACASGGPSGKEVLTGSIATSQSRLVIYRSSIVGLALQPSYTIDGKAVGTSQPNGFLVCNLNPGTYKVAALNLGGDESVLSTAKQTADVTLSPGRTTYIQAQPQMGLVVGYISLAEVAENEGRRATASMSQIKGTCA